MAADAKGLQWLSDTRTTMETVGRASLLCRTPINLTPQGENEQSGAVALKKRMVALPTSRCLICASSSHGAIPIPYQVAECGLPDISPP
jgi:hypothetical protein